MLLLSAVRKVQEKMRHLEAVSEEKNSYTRSGGCFEFYMAHLELSWVHLTQQLGKILKGWVFSIKTLRVIHPPPPPAGGQQFHLKDYGFSNCCIKNFILKFDLF